MRQLLDPTHIVAAFLYAAVGLGVFCAAFAVVDKYTPYNLWEEIVQKQNKALATIVGSISIGISIIVAAAILG